MVFEPYGATPQSLLGNSQALRIPIEITISRHRPLTTRMWERLFGEMSDAALAADLRLWQDAIGRAGHSDHRQGFDLIIRQKDRFVVTSVDRGSIEIVGGIFLAAAWAFKEFVKPGWEKSETKKKWDDGVAGIIDRAVPTLKELIDVRVVHNLKRFKVNRVGLRPPSDQPMSLVDNRKLETELLYEKPKQIEHKKNIP